MSDVRKFEGSAPLDARIALGEAGTWERLADELEQRAVGLREIARIQRAKAEGIIEAAGLAKPEPIQELPDNYLWLL